MDCSGVLGVRPAGAGAGRRAVQGSCFVGLRMIWVGRERTLLWWDL